MPTFSLHRKALPTAVAAALTIVAFATPAYAAPAADGQVVAKAAAYLASQLTPAGTVTGSFDDGKGNVTTYTDWGRTLDAALGLLAAGGQDATLGRTLTSVENPKAVAEYTQGAPGDKADAAYVGATAKLALVVALTGGDSTKVGGVNLIAQLTSLQTSEGQYADRSSFGSYANLFGHSFAILALKAAGQTVPDAVVNALLAANCPDGSYPETYPKAGTPCTGSVDATGLVLQALAAVGQGSSSPASAAASWLSGQQRSDGSFPGQAQVNSTAYAVLGLDAVGASIGKALDFLTAQQNADGGLRSGLTPTAGALSNPFATSQALPALAGKTFLASARAVARQATMEVGSQLIAATKSATVTAHAPAGSIVDLYAYSRPSTTFSIVRSATVGDSGDVSWTVSPLTNTRLFAQIRDRAPSPQAVLGVSTGLSLSAARTGTRTYVFSGRSIPARSGGLIVSLYRITADHHEVLTAQTRANATNGSWSLTRAFSGTGTFSFVVRTGSDLQNAAGRSNERVVTIS
jgi:hypothetical protein